MASKAMTQRDWYGILGAKPTDSQAELKRKYQKLALLYHPDKLGTTDLAGEPVDEGARRFIEINQAWKILGDVEKKREYDLQQREAELTRMWPVDTKVHLEEMSWDTDEELYAFPCRCGGRYLIAENELQHSSLVNCDSCSLIIEILPE
ncbi:dnaJ homolog subfamily C member 24 isoform 1-T2 [Rhinophrynus dorsalis]